MADQSNSPSGAILDELYTVIESRRDDDATASYTASLFAKGREKIGGKVVEEAVETMVASLMETPERVASESADVLYHLLVLWADAGVEPSMVWKELENRIGVSGLEEKRNRANHDSDNG